MLPVLTNRIHSALRVLAPWAVVVVNVSLASLFMWGLIRQYGISTVGSDGRMPTPWETGYAPYIVGLLTIVIVSAVLTAVRYRYGRHALMALTTIYTLCIYYSEVKLLLSMWHAGGQWTVKVILSDLEFFAVITAWVFLTYWSLFKACGPNNWFERSRVASSVGQGGSR